MLHLYRRPGEEIVINDNIWIHIVSVTANCVKIGIEAPREISVYRAELWQRQQAENPVSPKSFDQTGHKDV